MKKYFVIISFILIHSFHLSYSQEEWTTRTVCDTSFSFQMPSSPSDSSVTSSNIYYSYYLTESSCSLTCALSLRDSSFESFLNNIFEADSIDPAEVADSIKNPILGVQNAIFYLFKESEIVYNENITMEDSTITANEFHLTYLDENDIEMLLFTRFYYNGHDLLSFSVSGPNTNSTILNSIKNQYFDSVQLLNF